MNDGIAVVGGSGIGHDLHHERERPFGHVTRLIVLALFTKLGISAIDPWRGDVSLPGNGYPGQYPDDDDHHDELDEREARLIAPLFKPLKVRNTRPQKRLSPYYHELDSLSYFKGCFERRTDT